MRNIDFQTVHTQTPAVERSYQTRQAQVENEQRQANTVQQQAADAKMRETQSTPQTEGAKIQLEKRQEKRSQKRKKKSNVSDAHEEQQQEKKDSPSDSDSHRIDIRI